MSVNSRSSALNELENMLNNGEEAYIAEQEVEAAFREEVERQNRQEISEVIEQQNEQDMLSLIEQLRTLGATEEELNESLTVIDLIDLLEQYTNGQEQENTSIEGVHRGESSQDFREGHYPQETGSTDSGRNGRTEEKASGIRAESSERDGLNNAEDFVSSQRNTQENEMPESIPQGENRTLFEEERRMGEESDSEVPFGSRQEELRGVYGAQSEMQEYADRLGERISEAERERQKSLSKFEKEDIQRRVALDFAKEKNIWIDDFYSLGNHVLAGGNENSLIVDESTLTVFKANNLINSQGSISFLFDMVNAHNQIFPETRYEFVGFTGIDNGDSRTPYIEPIFKQVYIPEATQASQEDIDKLMSWKGFEKVNNTTFKNGDYVVSDLHPRNVLKDADNNIHVVDWMLLRGSDNKNSFENPKLQSKKKRFAPITQKSFARLIDKLKQTGLAKGVIVDKRLFDEKLKESNPELWAKGAELIKQSKYWADVNNNPAYSSLSEEQKIDEAMAMAIGDKGEAVWNEQQDITLYIRVKGWLHDMWQSLKGLFGISEQSNIEDMTLSDFTDMAIGELLSGENLQKSSENRIFVNENNPENGKERTETRLGNRQTVGGSAINRMVERPEIGSGIYRTIQASNSGGSVSTVYEAEELEELESRGIDPYWDKSIFRRELKSQAARNNVLLDESYFNDKTLIHEHKKAGTSENDVYLNSDNKTITKINNLAYVKGLDRHHSLMALFDRLIAHNTLFPEISYTIDGFVESKNGTISLAMRQPYVDAERNATMEEINQYLIDRGFSLSKPRDWSNGHEVWSDGAYELFDARPANVLKGKDGNLYFIDTFPHSVEYMSDNTGDIRFQSVADAANAAGSSMAEETRNELEKMLNNGEEAYVAEQEVEAAFREEVERQKRQEISDVIEQQNEQDMLSLIEQLRTLGIAKEDIDEAFTVNDLIDLLEQHTENGIQEENTGIEGVSGNENQADFRERHYPQETGRTDSRRNGRTEEKASGIRAESSERDGLNNAEDFVSSQRNTQENEIPESIPQGTGRSENEVNREVEEKASDNRREAIATSEARQIISGKESKQEQLSSIEGWAKDNGFWFDDTTQFGNEIARGGENEVYATDNDIVNKFNNFEYAGDDAANFFDRIDIHNFLFPDSHYTLIGFGRNSKGEVCAIVEQPFVVEADRLATQEEITEYMLNLGFKQEDEDSYINDQFEVFDAAPNNVLLGIDNKLHFIDTQIRSVAVEQTHRFRFCKR